MARYWNTPSFWDARNWKAELLLPFSLPLFLANRWREWRAKPQTYPIPILCIGNATAGGAGKTPTVIALCTLLAPLGKRIAIVSRGYGGTEKGPLKVDIHSHTATKVGDEPLLLASQAPTYIAEKRGNAIDLAIQDGAELILMDDGLQHYNAHKTASILVIDGPFGFGNGLLVPAGPLRDRLDKLLHLADTVLFIGEDTRNITETLENKTIFHASIVPTPPEKLKQLLREKPVIAFAGIGRPQKFFSSLEQLGANLVEALPFPDHYPYKEKDIHHLEALLQEHPEALCITTEKDATRLPPDFRPHIHTLPITLAFDHPHALFSHLCGALGLGGETI